MSASWWSEPFPWPLSSKIQPKGHSFTNRGHSHITKDVWETHTATCLKVVVGLDLPEEVEADMQELRGERCIAAAGSAQVRRAPCRCLVLQPQNHPEHSAHRVQQPRRGKHAGEERYPTPTQQSSPRVVKSTVQRAWQLWQEEGTCEEVPHPHPALKPQDCPEHGPESWMVAAGEVRR